MQIIGHSAFKTFCVCKVQDIEGIRQTPANSIVLFEFTCKELIDFCVQNSVQFALHVKSLQEVLFANLYGASFVVLKEELCENAQKIANDYMFDMKILVNIQEDKKIEELALKGIDGVIFLDNIEGENCENSI